MDVNRVVCGDALDVLRGLEPALPMFETARADDPAAEVAE